MEQLCPVTLIKCLYEFDFMNGIFINKNIYKEKQDLLPIKIYEDEMINIIPFCISTSSRVRALRFKSETESENLQFSLCKCIEDLVELFAKKST